MADPPDPTVACRHSVAQLCVYMSATATIRVPRETRDLLAARAWERGVSLSSLLTEFARRENRARSCSSLRARGDPRDLAAEEREWEAVLGDGFE